MDSATITEEIVSNPNRLPELLERAANEVERGLAALGRLPSARWALADVGEFLEGLSEGIAFAAERGSLVAQTFIRCFNESAKVPDLRGTARELRRIDGPTPGGRQFPDAARDFAEFLQRWLRVHQLAPDTPHVDKTQRQQQLEREQQREQRGLERDKPNTGSPSELSKHRSPAEWRRILASHGQADSDSQWRLLCKKYPDDVRGAYTSRAISRRLAEKLGIVDSIPEFRTATRK